MAGLVRRESPAVARAVSGASGLGVEGATKSPPGARVMADTIFRQLVEQGCDPRSIIAVSSELLGLVTDYLECSRDP